jgi:hypothetical protein
MHPLVNRGLGTAFTRSIFFFKHLESWGYEHIAHCLLSSTARRGRTILGSYYCENRRPVCNVPCCECSVDTCFPPGASAHQRIKPGTSDREKKKRRETQRKKEAKERRKTEDMTRASTIKNPWKQSQNLYRVEAAMEENESKERVI